MGDTPTKENDARLRTLARERVRDGTLPRSKALRTWGGFGTGAHCSLCKAPILEAEPEFELQFEQTAAPETLVRFHRVCHLAWEAACQELATQRWPDLKSLPAAPVRVDPPLELSDTKRSS